MGINRAVIAEAPAPGSKTKCQLKRNPKCHILPITRGLSMAGFTERFTALANGIKLFQKMAKKRYLEPGK
jgi:hypothetical protein